MNPKLSVSVIAHNEAHELPGCLASVRGLADERIVVDCASRDGTAAVARRLGARVFRRPNLHNLNVNKAFGVAQARGRWVLYLDPDERLTAPLRREIARVIRSGKSADAYEIPRRNFYFGRWLRWGGKYPDRQRRLFRRGISCCMRALHGGPLSSLGLPLASASRIGGHLPGQRRANTAKAGGVAAAFAATLDRAGEACAAGLTLRRRCL